MKFAAALVVSLSASTAGAQSLYPTNTTVSLLCDRARFDLAGSAASGSPTDASGCTSQCRKDKLFVDVRLDDTGHVSKLSSDRYAGCSFPTLYYVGEKTSKPCMHYSVTMGCFGFFTTIDSTAVVTKERILNATLWAKVTNADPVVKEWQIFGASREAESCAGTYGGDDKWITGHPMWASASGDVSNYRVDLTNFYKQNDAENGKFYIYAVPGGNTTVDESLAYSVYTFSRGPTQIGVSSACGTKTDCNTCVESCHWCQLTVGNVTSGLCGVTEDQCYARQSPYGLVSWYHDQCDTPEYPSTTSTTTKQAASTKATTAAPTIAAGARPLMLPFAGAVLLGATLAL